MATDHYNFNRRLKGIKECLFSLWDGLKLTYKALKWKDLTHLPVTVGKRHTLLSKKCKKVLVLKQPISIMPSLSVPVLIFQRMASKSHS